jgi:phage-related minor tail protein
VAGRASGGPVSGGRPYVVGERGPELFVPNIGGRIMNASQTAGAGGGQGVNLYQTNTFHGVDQQTILSGLKRNNQQLKAEIAYMIRRGDL